MRHIKRGRERDERDAGRMFISAHDFDLFELHTTRCHSPLSAHARSMGTVARPGLSDVVPARLLDTEHHSLALL